MKNRITTATKSIVASSNRLVPSRLAGGDITPRRTPAAAHGRWRLWSTHRLQKQFPFLPVDFTEKHSFLRALPMARPVPSPNCPLTAVCKLTSGTRPRDARSLLRRDLAADGRGKLSHSEVHRFILSRQTTSGSRGSGILLNRLRVAIGHCSCESVTKVSGARLRHRAFIFLPLVRVGGRRRLRARF